MVWKEEAVRYVRIGTTVLLTRARRGLPKRATLKGHTEHGCSAYAPKAWPRRRGIV